MSDGVWGPRHRAPSGRARSRALALSTVAMLFLAGCTTSPTQDPRNPASLGFVSSRVDLDGDGLYDAVNVTLLAAPGPIQAERVGFLVDGAEINTTLALGDDAWRVGRGALLPCEPGVHQFEVLLDGESKRVMVLECGVEAPRQPPQFGARIVDGNGDGADDAVELTLLGGGPVPPETLAGEMGGIDLRFYDTPLKSRLARSPLANGSRAWTPCVPGEDLLEITWRSNPLPALRLTGCDRFVPGVDAPLSISEVDVDGDRAQDGWNLTLGSPSDGPFPIAEVVARWGNRTAALNGSTALEAPPEAWSGGTTLVATCPGPGTLTFSLWVAGTLVFRSVAVCEEPPGRPLLELALEERANRLDATLLLSRVGELDASELEVVGFEDVTRGQWSVGETRVLPCPGGTLHLRYEGRNAFLGEAPC